MVMEDKVTALLLSAYALVKHCNPQALQDSKLLDKITSCCDGGGPGADGGGGGRLQASMPQAE